MDPGGVLLHGCGLSVPGEEPRQWLRVRPSSEVGPGSVNRAGALGKRSDDDKYHLGAFSIAQASRRPYDGACTSVLPVLQRGERGSLPRFWDLNLDLTPYH